MRKRRAGLGWGEQGAESSEHSGFKDFSELLLNLRILPYLVILAITGSEHPQVAEICFVFV